MIRVLLVEDERYVAESIVALLRAHGIDALPCESAEKALEAERCDVALVDLRLPGMSGLDLLRRLREDDPSLPVLMLTGHGTITDAVEAMHAGALDFLTKPVEPEVIIERLRKAVERRRIERERDRLRGVDGLVAESHGMRAALKLAEQVAAQPGAVLVTGASGTGKELLATYLHERSPRRQGPLVKVSCAAVPRGLFEVEFFGCKRGAYTGASRDREGWFAEADGGTLFLDEVGTLAPEGQAKLLRAIESGEVRPVGATEPLRVDVRIVAATNEDLAAARDAGRFRADLYYRLAVFEVALPPLRERPEDLLALAARFAAPLTLEPAAEQLLRRHAWPGNVRELRSVVEQARLFAKGGALGAADLEPLLPADESDLDLKRRTRALERQLFLEALRRCGGRKAEAARLLGIDPSNWAYHAKRLDL
ncbi:MAG TPA: sigma-54 dependent transcriptional regulator [Planctomycetota bacterium]|nr:sigma-54 dependent transcriptional regulator [Planctomycetota bacterium]